MGRSRKRLNREVEKVAGEIEKANKKLNNPSFVDRAPEAVVNEHRERRAEWEKKLEQLREMLGNLES